MERRLSGPLLCETIAAPTMTALRAQRDAVTHADLVELRLDLVDRPDVAGALAGRTRPVLVTCRAAWEGGGFHGSEEERQRILGEALDAGAEFVDIEWKTTGTERWLREADLPRVVLSMHDFEQTPDSLFDIARSMRRQVGPGVVKIATHARGASDLLTLHAIGTDEDAPGRQVVIGMGPQGVLSRILAAHFGSCWTYAGNAVAPGQIPAARLIEEFRFRSITPDTPVYAVVGRPIAHSLSPVMHNAAFAALGMDAVYVPFEATAFTDLQSLVGPLPIRGASVTAPFKEEAFASCVMCEDLPPSLTAVNTVRVIDYDSFAGRNTDIAGFLAPLQARLDLAGLRVAVLGAGGAARGIVFGLGQTGARVTVHARDIAKATNVAALAQGVGAGWNVPAGSWDLLVNTTPIGTSPNVEDTPFAGPFEGRVGGRLVYDLIYNPRPTRLLREAAAAGCETLDGLEMLVQQAVRQFAWWTGVTPDADIMRAAALRRLAPAAAPAEPTNLSSTIG